MIVSLIGGQGTGKTSLAEVLAIAIGANYIPEIAREVLIANNVTENLGSLPVEQIAKIQSDIYNAKMEQRRQMSGSKAMVTVEDRSPLIDVYAYSNYWLARHPSTYPFLDRIRDDMMDHVVEHDLIIVVPPNIPLVEDGVRSAHGHFRNTIHYITLGILESHGYDYHILKSDKIGDRLRECKGLIENYA